MRNFSKYLKLKINKLSEFISRHSHPILKYLTLLVSLASAVFVLFEWIKLPEKMTSWTISTSDDTISFMSLPNWLVQMGMTYITESTNQASAFAVIILVGVLKLACLASAELTLYGLWKAVVREKKSTCLKISQIMAVVLNSLAVIIIIVANILVGRLFPEMHGISFSPTVWMYLSFSMSVLSLIVQRFYNKNLKKRLKK